MRPPGNHKDLLKEDRKLPVVLGTQRTVLVHLIERLLVEALAGLRDAAGQKGAEVAHE
jgi:hypothetical protein